jgi:DinB superfamily
MAEMTDEQRRVLSYLRAQGAKLAPAELIDKVRVAMDDLRAALFSVPSARFDERPAPEEWSANEVIAHVVSAGALFGGGIERVLDGAAGGPPLADRIEAGVPVRSATEWWDGFTRDRTALFERVRRAAPDAHLDGSIEHGMFGPLNWREALLFLRVHDIDHAGQLKKIAAALARS